MQLYSLFQEEWQPVGDPYYHTASIKEIQDVLAQTNSGTFITIKHNNTHSC
jgi:hypothetical protein